MLNAAEISLLSRLFDEAQRHSGAELESWLAARSEAERGVLPQLRGMLERQQRAQGESTAYRLPNLEALQPDAAHAGERVGPYRLLRELGRGGMGEVWLAERVDGAFERQVALKLPHLAWGSTLSMRLKREGVIAAQLDHPHIARLYDAGSDERGRPFIAMAYIQGQAIDSWCQAHDADLRQRMQLAAQVARAVAYAHGRLIVHRDLKPANILVDADGQAHLLDFGIAKLLDATEPGLTVDATHAHTPRYAAPEQRAGRPITVATDVYALGLILFELLTDGLPPVDGEAPLASTAAQDPVRRRSLRGEIDAVLAKALALDPEARYSSAEAFADDLERHLAGKSVRARPDGALTRLRKLVWRNKLASGALATAVVALVGGGSAALLQHRQARQEAERARVVTQFVAEMFRLNAGARSAVKLSAVPDVVPEQFVDTPAQLIESRFADQPALQAELLGAVARLYVDLRVGEQAYEFAERQIAALRRIGAPREVQAEALLNAAQARDIQSRPLDAIQLARQALALIDAHSRQGFLGRTLLANFHSTAGQEEVSRALRGELEAESAPYLAAPSMAGVHFLNLRANALIGSGAYEEGLRVRDEAARMAQLVQGESSPTAIFQRIGMAVGLVGRDRIDEAFRNYQIAITALDRGGDAARLHLASFAAHFWERVAYHQGRSFAEIDQAMTGFLALIDHWGDKVVPKVRAQTQLARASALCAHGDLNQGVPLLNQAVPVLRQSNLAVREAYLLAEYQARAAMRTGRHAEADAHWAEVLSLREGFQAGTAAYASLDWQMAALNKQMAGDVAGAQAVLDKAPTQLKPLIGGALDPGFYNRVLPLTRLRLRLAQGDAAGTLAGLAALGVSGGLPAQPQRGEVDTDAALAALPGEAHCAAGQPRLGLTLLNTRIDRQAERSSPLDPGLARVRSVAALCALQVGERAQARVWRDEARQAFRDQPGVSPWYRLPLAELERRLR